jgi:hypothetical protein
MCLLMLWRGALSAWKEGRWCDDELVTRNSGLD